MLNDNLSIAMPALINKFNHESYRANVFNNISAPFFEIYPETYKIVLHVDAQVLDCENTGAPNHRFTGEIFLNTRLYELLYELPCERKRRTGQSNYLVKWSPYSRITRKDANNSTVNYLQVA